jgi:hypothetical protein
MHDTAAQVRVQTRRRQPLMLYVSSEPDVLLFSGAMAIVALHAAVDSFVAPEPGMTARDHLLRGLSAPAGTCPPATEQR